MWRFGSLDHVQIKKCQCCASPGGHDRLGGHALCPGFASSNTGGSIAVALSLLAFQSSCEKPVVCIPKRESVLQV